MPTPHPATRPRHARPGTLRAEQGSAAVWMIITAVSMTLLVGLAVDLSGAVHTKQRIQAIAAEAARTGGQHLHAGDAVRGHGAQVAPAEAAAAATTYLAGAGPGITAAVHVTSPTRVVVEVRGTYQTQFLSLIGVGAITVTGHAETETAQAVPGAAP